MRTTIDAAGRLVVPKPLREQLGFAPGSELDVRAVDGRLEVAVPSRVRVEQGRTASASRRRRGAAHSGGGPRSDGADATLTADSSAVIAAPSAWHERHEEAAGALREVAALPAHVLLEVYAVLTRLPAGLAVPATTAAGALADRFPDAVLTLADLAPLPAAFARADVFGGASHDGLVALEAAAHGRELVTLDERAQATYQRLGVGFRAL